jgi:rhodanese-related sulfurtransferase
MIQTIKKLFGMGPETNYAELTKQGAIILDVRSKGEYEGGHIKGSINIALDQLPNNLSKLKDKNRPIITCCASGMRSASAKSILLSNGYKI